MLRILRLSAIISIVFILGAPSCNEEADRATLEENELKSAKNEIRIALETEYLPEALLFAHEESAKQKLSDFADYLGILTDTALDMSFRLKAGEMIKTLFLTQDLELQLFDGKPELAGKTDIDFLISGGLSNQLPTKPFTFDSISVRQPLHRVNSTNYFGLLRFIQNYNDTLQPDQKNRTIVRSADFYTIREEKIFGRDTLNLWVTRLGGIRLENH
jgi:hypothetical protein